MIIGKEKHSFATESSNKYTLTSLISVRNQLCTSKFGARCVQQPVNNVIWFESSVYDFRRIDANINLKLPWIWVRWVLAIKFWLSCIITQYPRNTTPEQIYEQHSYVLFVGNGLHHVMYPPASLDKIHNNRWRGFLADNKCLCLYITLWFLVKYEIAGNGITTVLWRQATHFSVKQK